jgi:hypothetical protein
VYALILDDKGPPRYEQGLALDEALERPLDLVEAQAYDRERWGLSPEAVRAAEVKNAMFAGTTYE